MAGPLFYDRVKETTTTTGTGTVTLAGAADGYQSFAAIGDGNSCFYCISGQTGTEWEVGIGTYTASGTTLSRTTVISSSNANAAVNFSAGTKDVFCTVPAECIFAEQSTTAPTNPFPKKLWFKSDEGLLKIYYDGAWIDAAGGGGISSAPSQVNGRLTLESGVPISTTDQTAKTTVYFTPYMGNQITLWDGAYWSSYTFTETSLALGTISSGYNYDVFGYASGGTLALERLVWTNDTTRATAITLQDGRYCKSGDKTRLYLGTFRTTSTTTTEDSGGGTTTQVGGKRFLWNYYNRVTRKIGVKDTTASWSYTTNTVRQANGASGNKVELVIGVSEDAVSAYVVATISGSSHSLAASIGIGVDSTSTYAKMLSIYIASTTNLSLTVPYSDFLTAGYHYVAWLEKGSGSGTCTFQGFVANETQAGITATIQG